MQQIKKLLKNVVYDELVKKFNAFQINGTSNLVKKNHDRNKKYITSQECNQLNAENLAARLKHANLATEDDIHDFVKKTDFDDKLKISNKQFTLNKKKCFEAEKKLTDSLI